MQEYSSVTASSYDADSLAPLLTEKSAEGWSVVSIVSAGTNIVAYLERESDGTSPSAAPTSEASVDSTPAAADSPFAAETVTEMAPVDEPSGWAAAPEEPVAETPAAESFSAAGSPSDDVASLAAEVGATEEPAAEAVAEPVTEVAAAAPAVESTVPAGWYADPSARFELRYWDGNAWTEHVSRAGQQFTDPPVA